MILKYINSISSWLILSLFMTFSITLFSDNGFVITIAILIVIVLAYYFLNNINLPTSIKLFSSQENKITIKKVEPLKVTKIVEEKYSAPKKFESTIEDKIFEPIKKLETQKITEAILDDKIETWNPTEEIKILLTDVLKLTKELLFAHSAAFYWFNSESQQLVLGSQVTGSNNFTTQKKRTIAKDILSEAVTQKKVILINHLSSNQEETELGYYTSIQGIHSVIAIPILLQNEAHSSAVGVLVADSLADDAFGEESIGTMKNISQLISLIVKSHSEKFDLIAESAILKAEHRIRNKIQSEDDFVGVVNQLVEEVTNQISWNAISTILFDHDLQKWVIASSRTRFNSKYVVAKQEISLNHSIVGKTITENSIQSIDRFEGYQLPRFMLQEKEIGILGRGNFLSIPISGLKKCFGAITIEDSNNTPYTKKEIENIHNLALLCGLSLELQGLSMSVSFYKNSDEVLTLFKPSYFRERMEIELRRADDVGSEMALVLVSISNPDEIQLRFGPKGFLVAMKAISDIIVQNVRVYDILGRINGRTIGIILTHTTANEAYIWAEKIRSKVSSTSIPFEENSFSVTITCGVCGAIDGITTDLIIENAEEALNKALKTGGNLIGIY